MQVPFKALLAVAAGTVLAGCAAAPVSQLTGERYYRVPIDTYPVHIVSVDGSAALPGALGGSTRVDPGVRQIRVQAPPTRVQSFGGDSKTFTLDVKPCTRYHLVAVRATPLTREFEVRVDEELPLSGCSAG